MTGRKGKKVKVEGEEQCLELQRERRKNDGALLLKNFPDVVSGRRR